MQLSDIIKKIFEDKGVSPAEVSRRSGVPAAQISQIVNGVTKNPTWKIMVKLAAALEEPVSVFDLSSRDQVVADKPEIYKPDVYSAEERELIKYYRQLCPDQKLMIVPMMKGLLDSPTKSEENEGRAKILKVAN